MPNQTETDTALFRQALEKTPAGRAAFLDAACAGDATRRRRLEALLAGHEHPPTLLATVADSARPAPAISPPSEGPGTRVGRYKLLQKIGEGGMGVVYMAEQEEPVRRRVALKIIKAGCDSKHVIARFEAERQALALMDHPLIARVFDGGVTDDSAQPSIPGAPGNPASRPYFVMELVRGMPITKYCDEAKLSPRSRLDLFIQVCQAIQHAHLKGIIHRDIKPSNILVTINDGVPVPKVIDFGIAKATTEQPLTDKTLFTAFEQFIGTPAYMSPEQADLTSLDIDTRSDIYSLGVLLYELLTGQPPFDPSELMARGIAEMQRTLRDVEPPKPSTRLTRELAAASGSTDTTPAQPSTATQRRLQLEETISLLRGDLDWIVMKALEKDRARRYETASGLAADIERHLRHEPVIARPASLAYRLHKTVCRHRLAVAAGAAVTIALLAGLAVSTVLYFHARRSFRQQVAATAAAQNERQRADAEAESSRQARAQAEANVVRLNVAEGWRRVEEGDLFGALKPWAEAYSLEEKDPERATVHRMRLASVLQNCPKLVNVWSVGTNLTYVEFSRDGSRLVTANSLSTNRAVARIWESTTGRPLTPPMEHASHINSIQWSRDETKIVTASDDRTARVWDAQTGAPVSPPLRAGDHVNFASLNSTTTQVVGVGGQYPMLWETATGEQIWSAGENRISNAPSIMGDGLPVIFSSDDKHVITRNSLHRISDGASVKLFQHTECDGVHISWQITADGSRNPDLIANVRRSGLIVSHFPSPDHSRQQIFFGEYAEILCEVHKYQFRAAFFGNETNTSGFAWDYHENPGATIGRFSHDGYLATAGREGVVKVVHQGMGGEVGPLIHQDEVVALAFGQSGKMLVSGSLDGRARVWDSSGAALTLWLPHRAPIVAVALAAHDVLVITTTTQGEVSIWDTRTGAFPWLTLPAAEEASDLELSPSGDFLVEKRNESRESKSPTAQIWNLESKTLALPLLTMESSWYDSHSRTRFDGDTWTILTETTQTSYNLKTGSLNKLQVTNEQESPSAESEKDIRAFRGPFGGRRSIPRGGERIFEHRSPIKAGCVSHDGKLIAGASVDGMVRYGGLATGEEWGIPFRHSAAPLTLAITPDKKKLLVQQPGGVFIWQLPEDNRSASEWLRLAEFYSVSSPDGTNTVSQSSRLSAWQELQQSRPDLWQVRSDEIDARERHQAWQSGREGREGDWNQQEIEHLTRLIERLPFDADLFARRAASYVRSVGPISSDKSLRSNQVLLVERAIEDWSRVLEWVDRFPAIAAESRKNYLTQRAYAFRSIGKNLEAGADFLHCRAQGIPDRPSDAASTMVDLGPWYTSALQVLAPARILKSSDTISFDLRGTVKGSATPPTIWPDMQGVSRIPVGQRARRVHFLLGGNPNRFVDLNENSSKRPQLGTLVMRYVSGETQELPIIMGDDVWGFTVPSNGPKPTKNSTVAWIGPLDQNDPQAGRAHIFHRPWDNPNPELEIASIDYIVPASGPTFNLFAITCEP